MTNRIDIHSPKNMVVTSYDFVGPFYQGTFGWNKSRTLREMTTIARDALRDSGWTEGNHHTKGSCDHCGAHFHYGAVLRHTPTGDCIAIGGDCLDTITTQQGYAAQNGIKILKKAVADRRDRVKRIEKFNEYIVEHDLTTEFGPDFHNAPEMHYIVADIRSKLHRYSSISDPQIALVRKIYLQDIERAQRAKELEARKAADKLTEKPVPMTDARITIIGEVLAKKIVESVYGDTLKFLVKSDDGFKAWSTIPSSMGTVERGDRVSFVAKITPSNDDPCFGFCSRPSKGTVVQESVR
jgi:hypothetical protein